MTDVYEALEAARADFPAVVADARNPHFKNRYATLGAVLEAVEPVLRQHRLAIFQWVGGSELVTTLRLLGPVADGEPIRGRRDLESTYPLVANDNPQQFASAITYARRYALTTLLGIVVDTDDDGNAASGRRAPQAPESPERPLESSESPAGPPPGPTAQEQGWDSEEQRLTAHQNLQQRIRDVNSPELTETAKAFSAKHGWPCSVGAFNELEEAVRVVERLQG